MIVTEGVDDCHRGCGWWLQSVWMIVIEGEDDGYRVCG